MKIDYISDYPMPWKIDSPIERLLGKMADRSELMKLIYIYYYKCHDSEFHKVAIEKINKTLSESELICGGGINKKKISRDMLYSFHRFGLAYFEYVMIRADLLNKKGREEYLTDRMRFSYYKLLNADNTHHFFDNKDETYQMFKKYYKRDFLAVRGHQDEASFLAICNKYNKLCVKPLNSSGGKGVMICNSDDMINHGIDFYLKRYPDGFAIEEVVKQASEIAFLHKNSLNTLRLCTIFMDDRIEILNAFFRIGIGKNVVDNGASGGILTSVDINTGIVIAAKTENGKQYLIHPDTGKQIIGYKIPRWEEAKSLVLELAKVIPRHRCTGWDIALTEDGWIMIEGNDHSQFLAQLVDCNGIRSYMDDIVKELNH